MQSIHAHLQRARIPWNSAKLVGQKSPFKLKYIWAIRVRLQLAHRTRELALLNLALDSKLRGCDLVRLRVQDVCHEERVANRAIVLQQKTERPVQFEITEMTRTAIAAWIEEGKLSGTGPLFPSRLRRSPHLSARQYARILNGRVREIGLDKASMAPTQCAAVDRAVAIKATVRSIFRLSTRPTGQNRAFHDPPRVSQ